MNIKEQCEKYLRYKYEYYILCKPTISDIQFDRFEKELRSTNDTLALEVVDMTDFPSLEDIIRLGFDLEKIAPEQKIKRDETKYNHWTKMQSISKLQVNDEQNIPYKELKSFLGKKKSEYYECSCKYDGNSMDLMYDNGKLIQALTRGDGIKGLDRTKKIRLIVPNYINMMGKIEIRGEIVVKKDLWKKKYFVEGEVSNERNWVAGAISKEDFDFTEIHDLVFVAYSLVRIEPLEYIENTMKVLKDMGFNKTHEPFLRHIKNSDDFEKMYFEFKEYRKNCEFLLDGIVIKYPENMRLKMPSRTKYPAWSLAIKFESEFAETPLLDYEWSQGKNGEFCPIGLLKEVELGGTMNKRASCHNMSFIINNGCFPGCIVKIRKAGEIINQVVEVIKKSPNHDEYMKQFENFKNITKK
jgi:DNA ligase (NAD+)